MMMSVLSNFEGYREQTGVTGNLLDLVKILVGS